MYFNTAILISTWMIIQVAAQDYNIQCKSSKVRNLPLKNKLWDRPTRRENHDNTSSQKVHWGWGTSKRRTQLVVDNAITIDKKIQLASQSKIVVHENTIKRNMSRKLWPPWPFSLFDRDSLSSSTSSVLYTNSSMIQRIQYQNVKQRANLLLTYLRERAKIGTYHLQQVGSDIAFQLPPASLPLLLLTILPTEREIVTKSITSSIRFTANDLARKFAFASLGTVVLSWADYEIRKKRCLVPIQLHDYKQVVLPPFLPEHVPPPELDPLLSDEYTSTSNHLDSIDRTCVTIDDDDDNISWRQKLLFSSPTLKTVIQKIQQFTNISNMDQKRRRDVQRRQHIIDKLLIIQQLKREKQLHSKLTSDGDKNSIISSKNQQLNSGYALVTGASRGIGRAFAVELARWGIPLILVARDFDKLTILANELEACYGVTCYVLKADLAETDAAYTVYNTTKEAGLRVDILVNNAGICTRGEMVESSAQDISRMMQVNVASVTTLSQLYGKDMKDQRRGRILFVSSVAGGAPGGPEIAAYAATKAYERSLSLALSMELERYGVGVTCLMPGAVKGTSFASSGKIEDAVCWKVPCYAMTPPDVASRGVRAMFAGAVEIVPGWHNRSFVKVLVPLLPQRLSTRIASLAFSPLSFDALKLPWSSKNTKRMAIDKPKDNKGESFVYDSVAQAVSKADV